MLNVKFSDHILEGQLTLNGQYHIKYMVTSIQIFWKTMSNIFKISFFVCWTARIKKTKICKCEREEYGGEVGGP